MRGTADVLFVQNYLMSWVSTKLLKFILSNRQCVLLLHAWGTYVKHAKHAKHAEHAEIKQKTSKTNLTIKDHGIWKIKEVTIPILNWLLFSVLFISHFWFGNSTRTRQSPVKYTQRFTEAGAGSYWQQHSS